MGGEGGGGVGWRCDVVSVVRVHWFFGLSLSAYKLNYQ